MKWPGPDGYWVSDDRALYRRQGFGELALPERWMERPSLSP